MSKRIYQSDGETKDKKILFTASTMSHIENFHLPYLRAFEEMDWEVDAIVLPVSKSFFSVKNIKAINYARGLIKSNNYDYISSQSTLAGIVTRLAVMLSGRARKKMKVFHTAHGYLFYDNKNLKKWAYLLPEIICSKVTDVLMVMNHDDLEIAKKYKLCKRTENIHYINGMGIDLSRFQTTQGEPRRCAKEQKASFGIADDDFVFVYAAEFSKRKNHELLLKGFAEAAKQLQQSNEGLTEGLSGTSEDSNDLSFGSAEEGSKERVEKEAAEGCKKTNLKLVLAGDGVLFEKMKTLASNLGIRDRVIFLGYIKNIHELYPCCDVAVSTSKIEGLPFNIMEAMVCGLPVVASDIKGHRELIEHGVNGLLFESGNQEELSIILFNISKQLSKPNTFKDLGDLTLFSKEYVFPKIMGIYLSNQKPN